MSGDRWSVHEVLRLAPDERSVRAARALAGRRTWSQLGCTDTLVFGRCQGSGRDPYRVTVDLTEPAFRCTCPSQKQPCKHGIALLLLWVEHADAVARHDEAAAFADEWAAERAARREERRVRGAREPARVGDPEAQAKRLAQRLDAMTAGLDELERWMGDLVRQGLASARRQPYAYWDDLAGRLVDAQVPTLAERVREVGGSVLARDDWPDVLLSEIGRWQLAVEAWRRRGQLPPDTLGDLRAFLGWPRRSDEVATFDRVHDEWVVAAVRQGQDERITSQRTWLWGRRSGRWAVVLDFAAAGASLHVAHVVGSVVEDRVVVHPGSAPPRVALSGEQRVVGAAAHPAASSVAATVDELAGWLAANPWRDRFPVALERAVAVRDHDRWWLQDGAGDRLPLAAAEPWLLLAHTGGVPATVVGEWDAGVVHPLAVRVPSPAGAAPVPL